MAAVKRILVLGGYGNFGKRIVEGLLSQVAVILVAGRSLERSLALCQSLQKRAIASLEPVQLDAFTGDFSSRLQELGVDIVIHTCGPFQGQDYSIPMACIDAGCHYIDLADDRRFVCDITELDNAARAAGVLVISGASSVPGLSSVVLDHFLPEFQSLETIDFAIAPGNRAERGEATVAAILSYTGHPFEVFEDSRWQRRRGWLDSRRRDFSRPVGRRYLANIDIPDLELFPQRYPGVKTVRFQAGLELAVLHYGMVAMAALVKWGLIKNWRPYANTITRMSRYFEGFGSDHGAMQICMAGLNNTGEAMELEWTLTAENGIGPFIPTMSAIILAKKLLVEDLELRGAMPCLGLFSLQEFEREIAPYKIYHNSCRRPL